MHAARNPITKDFPDSMPHLAGHFRGRLALAVNPQSGDHLCISCLQCERVCPDKCIEITSHKSPETNKPELINFRIDHGLCMFCGLCTEVCPTSCIINTNDFEMADYSRESLIFDLRKLTLTQDESAHYFNKKELPMPKPKPAKPAAKPAAAAAAKPAPDKPAATPEAAAQAKPEAKPAATAEAAKPAVAPDADKTKELPKAGSDAAEAKPEDKDSAKPAENKGEQ
jgi:NADH-quinone oxidoreductase chain I